MSTGEKDLDSETGTIANTAAEEVSTKRKLDLDVQITDVGPCKKHLKVAISKAEIDRQFDESLGTMKKEAAVPGFRPGRAPRQLVEKRFRKQVAEQVKSTLLMSALEQLDEEHKLNPITQPNLDLDAIKLPDDGPMRFEIEVEVRPEFAIPNYKSLVVKRPSKVVSDSDLDTQYQTFLERYAQLVPKTEGGAALGDYITADLRFFDDNKTLNEAKEIQFRLQPELRFQDGTVPNVSDTLVGVKPDEERETEALIGSSSADPELRGKAIKVAFKILDLKQLRMPDVDSEFFNRIGFDSKEDLTSALRDVLERRYAAAQRQAIRRDVMEQLSSQTPFELPTDLVSRQEKSTIRRLAAQMKQDGLSEGEIRAREAEIRANAHETTLRTLKEFFIFAKIAEAEDIKVDDVDLDEEVNSIALRSGENPRRVRSRIEKDGMADAIASDILERKTLDRILETVTYDDVPLEVTKDVETLDQSAGPLEEDSSTQVDSSSAASETQASEEKSKA